MRNHTISRELAVYSKNEKMLQKTALEIFGHVTRPEFENVILSKSRGLHDPI